MNFLTNLIVILIVFFSFSVNGIFSDKQLFWQAKIKEELKNTLSFLSYSLQEKTETKLVSK